jgi:hypothetical protein
LETAAVQDTRPVKIQMLVTDAWRICRENPRDYFGMAAVISLAPLALGLLSMARDPKDMMSPRNLLPGLFQLILVIVSVLYVIYMLGAYPLLAARSLNGHPMRWTAAISWLREREMFSGILLVIVLQALAALGGLLLLVVPGIIFAVLFMLVIPARVLGDHRGRDALSESNRIVKPVLIKGALSFAGLMFIPWAVVVIVQVIFGTVYGMTATTPIRVIPPALITYLVTALWTPIDQVAHALLYIERSGGISAQRKDLFV